jgi:uncharacterized protein (DUF2344 family)
MAKGPKVKYDDSDDDDEPSVAQLMDMLEQAEYLINSKSKKCKALLKKVHDLEHSLSELEASHECLKEDHKDLKVAHSKLEKAHSLLVEKSKKEDVVVACDVGVTCDIINKSFYQPIVITPLMLLLAHHPHHDPPLLLPSLLVMVSLMMPH